MTDDDPTPDQARAELDRLIAEAEAWEARKLPDEELGPRENATPEAWIDSFNWAVQSIMRPGLEWLIIGSKEGRIRSKTRKKFEYLPRSRFLAKAKQARENFDEDGKEAGDQHTKS